MQIRNCKMSCEFISHNCVFISHNFEKSPKCEFVYSVIETGFHRKRPGNCFTFWKINKRRENKNKNKNKLLKTPAKTRRLH